MPTSRPTASLGLVHDYLLVLRGAERTFQVMADLWSDAPIYTLLYDRTVMAPQFAGRSITTSGLQRLGVGQSGFRRLLPLFPKAAERLPVAGHGTVISSSSAFALGVRPSPNATHICYCHSPFRYAWHEEARALAEVPTVARPALRELLRRIRTWDRKASHRVTHFVANARVTQQRIEEFYGRDSVIVHPPVDVDRFQIAEAEDYAVFVGEVVGHKRIELALEAAKQSGVRLKVVGTGPALEKMTALYGDGADFLGRLDDRQLAAVIARARVAIVPNVEEFGIAAVEAQAAGRPVLAANAGGARETVIDGETGVLVPSGDLGAMAEALREVDFHRFDAKRIAAHAQQFSTTAFKARLRRVVEDATRVS